MRSIRLIPFMEKLSKSEGSSVEGLTLESATSGNRFRFQRFVGGVLEVRDPNGYRTTLRRDLRVLKVHLEVYLSEERTPLHRKKTRPVVYFEIDR